MPSFRHLLSAHPALLLIDTASARVQVGLWQGGDIGNAAWRINDSEASEGLFASVESLLRDHGRAIAEIDAFAFCEGPGSVLGIRTAAVALRVWRVLNPAAKIYAYQSLHLIAHSLNRPEVNVIADARRNTWHVTRGGSPLRRVTTAELTDAGELVMPAHFRHWTALPAGVQTTSYDLAALLPTIPDADLFHLVTEPDAFQYEDNAYVTWTPQIHQAPAPRPL